ncbi:MAG: helix-turn-helix transcriptional regulator [Mesorhizobium sp.]|nr:MAG: helix-turn-helix transcriptional regulator [Mesorhizobium sp.]TIO37153.1 MAG: helix-turn-helix transcriptional regulator [Mesorhizobium sp.]
MMPGIPLPFVISLLLIILLVRLINRRESALGPEVAFVGACATLVTIAGLRWSFDVQAIRFIQPVIAASLPPIAWFCFAGLTGARSSMPIWLHAIPIGIVAILSATWMRWQPPIDLILAALFLGYGFALLRLASAGPDGLGAARLADAAKAQKATLIAGLVLIGSGVVDLLIAGDFNFYQGTHAASIVAIANLLTLPLIAYAVAVVGKSVSPPEAMDAVQDSLTDRVTAFGRSEPSDLATANDTRIVETVDRLMREKQLFRDPDLTLNRLARRAAIPSRQISAAINRVCGRNVSQAVNEYRIEQAKRLLANSDLPITTIMFEAGFQTKSNFNREFLRLTGTSPSDYRRSSTQNRNESGAISVESPAPGTR